MKVRETFSGSYPTIWSILYGKFSENKTRIGLDWSQGLKVHKNENPATKWGRLAALQSIEYNRANSNRAIEGRKQSGNRAVGPIELEDQASNRVYLRIFIQIPNEAILKLILGYLVKSILGYIQDMFLVPQEDMPSCATRRHVFLCDKKTCLLVPQETCLEYILR